MTKRRWLKTAIEESRKTDLQMPWEHETTRTDAKAAAPQVSSKPVGGVPA